MGFSIEKTRKEQPKLLGAVRKPIVKDGQKRQQTSKNLKVNIHVYEYIIRDILKNAANTRTLHQRINVSTLFNSRTFFFN
jgi:hypothetical protein